MEHGLLHATHSSLVLLLRIRTLAGEGGGAVAAVAAVSQQGLELSETKQGLELGETLALSNYQVFYSRRQRAKKRKKKTREVWIVLQMR